MQFRTFFRPVDTIVLAIKESNVEKFDIEDLKSLLKFVPDKTIVSEVINKLRGQSFKSLF